MIIHTYIHIFFIIISNFVIFLYILGDGSMDDDDNLPQHSVEINVDKRRKSLPGTATIPGSIGGLNNKREK